MARLDRIVLQGFKSFKRKTSIPFPTGFSVITGPNGAGKSNVGDAVAFVLGKSSSKALRAKKAKDLVFHGSAVDLDGAAICRDRPARGGGGPPSSAGESPDRWPTGGPSRLRR